MKFIRKFLSETEMNDAISQIKNSDEIFIFTTNQLSEKQNVVYIPSKPVPDEPVYSVNMSPVKLDSTSTKKKPVVGDVLYSTVNGKLTLDAQTDTVDNTPIAICVIPEVLENFSEGDDSVGAVKTARFTSINYMSWKTPITGSVTYDEGDFFSDKEEDIRGYSQIMYFGNNSVTVGNVKGSMNKTSYVGGKWNTQKCLYACTKENKDLTNGVTNKSDPGYCAPACCCFAYSTPGTKSGDWYLPTPGELYQIIENKTVLNKKRTVLVGNEFSDYFNYWTCLELNNTYEASASISYTSIGGSYKTYRCISLAFLALEY